MALIKYNGTDNIVINLNGERKLIKPNKIFSGPISIGQHDNFEIIGYSKEEDQKIGNRGSKSIKFDVKDYYVPMVDLNYLDESGSPKISICIVTKDGNGVIQRCVDSIFKHNTYPFIEVLICDTGTTDQSVLNYYEQIKDKVKLFLGHSYNFSKNNNFLAEQSTGDVLLFMNNDVFMTYDVINEMVKYILCSNIGCLGHRLVFDADQQSIQHDGQVIYDVNNGNWIGPGHYSYKQNINQVPNKNCVVEGVTAAFLMMRKSVFNKVKGFNEDYVDIYQDVDLNLKVSSLGFDNFCIREKALIHVDHSTRKTDTTPESLRDAKKYKDDWINKGPYVYKKKCKYSILVCATNKRQLSQLLQSIKTVEEYEFIFVNNKNNFFWSSEALNQLTRVSSGEIIFWMHQDVTFDAYEPFATINNIITQIGNFGILGPAGVQVGDTGAIRGVDFSSLKYNFDYMRCQTLDEFCLIGKRSNGLQFGEYLDHFHFYGADICLQASEKNLSNFVIKIPITHHSGGDVNLKNGDGYHHYREQGKKMFHKWGRKYPKITTTTAHFRDDNIHWFLGHKLGLTPYIEQFDASKFAIQLNIKQYIKNII